MDKFNFLEEKLDNLRHQHLLRSLSTIEYAADGIVRFQADTSEKTLLCSNDYLSISNDPRVIDAVSHAAAEFGYGACSSRLICGTHKLHTDVESAFRGFLGTDSALLFNSGWTANEALLKTLPEKGDIVLIDRYDHASIIDAAKASDAKFKSFRRNDLSKLEKHLSDDNYKQKYIVTESVFSMDGDTADLVQLVELKNRYNAILIVDQAHDIGCLGTAGAGLIEELSLTGEIDIIVAPLGKAFAASGAIIGSNKKVIEYLTSKARAFIYTTAPPPVNCAAILAALDIIKTEPKRRKRLAENARYLRDKLNKAGFGTANSTTHIVPVIIGDADKTVNLSKELLKRGFFACAIRPPTVPNGSSRLRISLQANHTKQQLDDFVLALDSISL